MRKSVCLIVVITLALVAMPGIASAQWSGSQTVTFEATDDGTLIHYLSILDYAVTDDWYVTLTLDQHQTKGLDGEISTTIYWRPFGQVLYTTAGVRKGLHDSETGWNPYLSITYRF